MLNTTPEVKPTDSPSAVEPNLRAIFEAEESTLLRLAFSLVGRRAVAEEIVQDAFLQLHVHWDSVDAPRAWLVRSIRNRALNHLRKTKREFWFSDGESPTLADGDCDTPNVLLEKLETVAELRRLVQELPADDRRLIELRYFDGLKYREISTSVGLTVSNVGFRLHRVLQQLASRLQSRDLEDDS
jgi:RNA polymerase sigma factor (sigma-70 family)